MFGSKLTPDVNRSGENRQKCQKNNFFSLTTSNIIKKNGLQA